MSAQASEPNLFTNFKLRDDEAEHSVAAMGQLAAAAFPKAHSLRYQLHGF